MKLPYGQNYVEVKDKRYRIHLTQKTILTEARSIKNS